MNDNQKLEMLDELESAVEKLLSRNLNHAKLLNPHLSPDAQLIMSIVSFRLETESSISPELTEKILSDIQEFANTIEEAKRGIQ